MLDFLFEDAGGKLSSIIKFFTKFEIIVFAILGIILGIFFADETDSIVGFIVPFIVISVITPIIIWMGSLLIISLLDMMSDVKQIKNHIKNPTDLTKEENKQLIGNNSKTANAEVIFNSFWTCSQCGAENDKNVRYCEKCGRKKP